MSDEMNISDLSRLEKKLDKLTDAVSKLILLEERQVNQASRLSVVETRLDSTEKRVDQWVNRGIGMWALGAVLFALAIAAINILKQAHA